MLAAACLLLAACGANATATPSPTSSVEPNPSFSTPSIAAPSVPSDGPSPSVDATGPYPIVQIPENVIRSVVMPSEFMQAHRMRSDGPFAVLDELGPPSSGHGQGIWLVDLTAGTARVIATASGSDVAWAPDISGRRIVWTEWHYANVAAWSGTLAWRVMALDLDAGGPTIVAHGTNARLDYNNGRGGLQAAPPLAQVDGNLIAYTLEDTGPGRPQGWKIVIRSLADGAVERTVPTKQAIYSLALANDSVAWSEGLLDLPGSFTYAARLMVSTPEHPRPREVAKDAFEVLLDSDRLSWIGDPIASQKGIGLAQHPRLFTAVLDDLRADPVSAPADGIIEKGAYWPAAGDGFITWADDQDTGPDRHPDPTGDHLVVWDQRSDQAVQLEPTAGMILSGVGGGWLTWYDDWRSPRIIVAGIPIASAGLP